MSVVPKLRVKLVKTSEKDAQIIREILLARKRWATSLQRIQWLVQFAELASSDPAHLTPAELVRWSGEMFGFAMAAGQPQPPFRKKRSGNLLGLTAEEIVEFAQRIRDGMVKLVKGEMWAFALSGLPAVDVSLTSPKHGPPQRVYAEDVRGILIMAAMDALVVESHRLAKCQGPSCERLFVRRKRGAYCSRTCSQRARTLRYYERHPPEERSEKRHAWYVEKVKRELGPKIKVRRNQRIIPNAEKERRL